MLKPRASALQMVVYWKGISFVFQGPEAMYDNSPQAGPLYETDERRQPVRFSRQKLVVVAGSISLGITATIAFGQVTTSQYDNMRTGTTLNEKILTSQNVNASHFGKLGAFKVDGAVYAQPLFVSAVEIPGKGKHDLLFVATEHDSVYAFDADQPDAAPLWHVSFLDGKRKVTAVPSRDVQCPFIQPEVGITSTPVIDLKTGTLYVLARTMTESAIGSSEYFSNYTPSQLRPAWKNLAAPG
jgi:hypothetical protein